MRVCREKKELCALREERGEGVCVLWAGVDACGACSVFQSEVESGIIVTGDWSVCGTVLTRSMLSRMKMMLGDLLCVRRLEREVACVRVVRRKSCAR